MFNTIGKVQVVKNNQFIKGFDNEDVILPVKIFGKYYLKKVPQNMLKFLEGNVLVGIIPSKLIEQQRAILIYHSPVLWYWNGNQFVVPSSTPVNGVFYSTPKSTGASVKWHDFEWENITPILEEINYEKGFHFHS